MLKIRDMAWIKKEQSVRRDDISVIQVKARPEDRQRLGEDIYDLVVSYDEVAFEYAGEFWTMFGVMQYDIQSEVLHPDDVRALEAIMLMEGAGRLEDLALGKVAKVRRSLNYWIDGPGIQGVRFSESSKRNGDLVVTDDGEYVLNRGVGEEVNDVPDGVKHAVVNFFLRVSLDKSYTDEHYYQSDETYIQWSYGSHREQIRELLDQLPEYPCIFPGDSCGVGQSLRENSVSGDKVPFGRVEEETIMQTIKRGLVKFKGKKIVVLSYVAVFMEEDEWALLEQDPDAIVLILDNHIVIRDRLGEPQVVGPHQVAYRLGLNIRSNKRESVPRAEVSFSENLLHHPLVLADVGPSAEYLLQMNPQREFLVTDEVISKVLRAMGYASTISQEGVVLCSSVQTLLRLRATRVCYLAALGTITDVNSIGEEPVHNLRVRTLYCLPKKYQIAGKGIMAAYIGDNVYFASMMAQDIEVKSDSSCTLLKFRQVLRELKMTHTSGLVQVHMASKRYEISEFTERTYIQLVSLFDYYEIDDILLGVIMNEWGAKYVKELVAHIASERDYSDYKGAIMSRKGTGLKGKDGKRDEVRRDLIELMMVDYDNRVDNLNQRYANVKKSQKQKKVQRRKRPR